MKLIQKNLKQLQAESDKRDAKLYANMFVQTTKDPSVGTKVSCLESSLNLIVLMCFFNSKTTIKRLKEN